MADTKNKKTIQESELNDIKCSGEHCKEQVGNVAFYSIKDFVHQLQMSITPFLGQFRRLIGSDAELFGLAEESKLSFDNL